MGVEECWVGTYEAVHLVERADDVTFLLMHPRETFGNGEVGSARRIRRIERSFPDLYPVRPRARRALLGYQLQGRIRCWSRWERIRCGPVQLSVLLDLAPLCNEKHDLPQWVPCFWTLDGPELAEVRMSKKRTKLPLNEMTRIKLKTALGIRFCQQRRPFWIQASWGFSNPSSSSLIRGEYSPILTAYTE